MISSEFPPLSRARAASVAPGLEGEGASELMSAVTAAEAATDRFLPRITEEERNIR